MADIIICMNDHFFLWSTVAEGPTTYAGTREEFEEFYLEEYGIKGMQELHARIERAIKTGTSSLVGYDIESLTKIAGLNGHNEWDTPKKLYAYVTKKSLNLETKK